MTLVHVQRVIIAVVILAGTATDLPAQCECRLWTRLFPANKPAPRAFPAMAFDSRDDVNAGVVLFGGTDLNQRFGDTWVFNGVTWTLKATTGPAPRYEHAMVFDSNRNRVVMFGGNDTAVFGDTWEWNGTSWALVATSGPSARINHTMVFDSARGKTVLYGGVPSGGGANGETWEWDGFSWTQGFPAQSPGPRNAHSMAYDSRCGKTVLIGGIDQNSQYGTGTWLYDGTNWTLVNPSTSPAPTVYSPLVYDSQRGRCVLATTFPGGTWEWDGTNWEQVVPPGGPEEHSYAGLAYDSSRSRTVQFGGYDFFAGMLDVHWEWFSNGSQVSFSQQPVDASVNANGQATFTIVANGTGPLFYQWRRSGANLNNGGNISGANAPTLTINPITLNDVHAYDCVVSGACGAARSDPASPRVTPCAGDFNGDGFINSLDTQYFVNLLLNTNGICP